MKKLLAASCALLATVAAVSTQTAVESTKLRVRNAMAQVQSQVKAQAQADCPQCGGVKCCPRDECERVDYDHSCEWLRDTDCLRNEIILKGPKVVLVNLDDRCDLEQYEREGVFLEVGDILIVTGREDVSADRLWFFDDCEILDEDILELVEELYEELSCFDQAFLIFEGVGMGMTRLDLALSWGDVDVRKVSLDVYVGMRPQLSAVTSPRHSCHWCNSSDRWDMQ
jgi:hypothetical protein